MIKPLDIRGRRYRGRYVVSNIYDTTYCINTYLKGYGNPQGSVNFSDWTMTYGLDEDFKDWILRTGLKWSLSQADYQSTRVGFYGLKLSD